MMYIYIYIYIYIYTCVFCLGIMDGWVHTKSVSVSCQLILCLSLSPVCSSFVCLCLLSAHTFSPKHYLFLYLSQTESFLTNEHIQINMSIKLEQRHIRMFDIHTRLTHTHVGHAHTPYTHACLTYTHAFGKRTRAHIHFYQTYAQPYISDI